MRPLRLVFSGLNSYREEQSIDFTTLTQDGLFGIFGVTGAGKSTILDAMTLALFGDVVRAPNHTQGIINSRETKCHVSFTFELSTHIYCVERSYQRKKGDAFSVQFKRGRFVVDNTSVLAEKNEEITRAAKDLLHMNGERFCQTVILPQGKFDRFLRMAPGDRSKMFEELFDLGRYGKSLSNKAALKLNAAEERLRSLEAQQGMLGEYSATYQEQLQQQIQVDSLRQQELCAADEDLQRQLHHMEYLCRQAQVLASKQQELAALTKQSVEIEALRRQLQQAEAAEPLRADLAGIGKQYASLKEAQQQAQQQQRRADEAAQANKLAKDKLERAEAHADAMREQEEALRKRLSSALQYQQQVIESQRDLQALQDEAKRAAWEEKAIQCQQNVQASDRALAQTEEKQSLISAEHDRCFQQWELVTAEFERQRTVSAAAFLAHSLREGEPCPVCGSSHHPQPLHAETLDASLLQQAQQEQDLAKKALDAASQRLRHVEDELRELRAQNARLREDWRLAEQVLTASRTRIAETQSRLESLQSKMQQAAGCDDPQQALLDSEKRMSAMQAQLLDLRAASAQAAAAAQETAIGVASAESSAAALLSSFEQLQQRLLLAVKKAGFALVNQARKSLLEPNQRQEIATKIKEYEDKLHSTVESCRLLEDEIKDYDESALLALKTAAASSSASLAEVAKAINRNEVLLERAQEDSRRAEKIEGNRKEVQARVDTYKRLVNLLKGNAFVRYLSRNSLLAIAYDASTVLASLSAQRYQLELIEDSRGSDFIIVDNMNGGVRRQVSGLSGGETFIVSLSLALALARKIQMQSAPLGFFFLDEGFGSLDEASLTAVMDVLERLPSSQRCVGVITHVAAVRERMPRYLEVVSDPATGSHIKMRRN